MKTTVMHRYENNSLMFVAGFDDERNFIITDSDGDTVFRAFSDHKFSDVIVSLAVSALETNSEHCRAIYTKVQTELLFCIADILRRSPDYSGCDVNRARAFLATDIFLGATIEKIAQFIEDATVFAGIHSSQETVSLLCDKQGNYYLFNNVTKECIGVYDHSASNEEVAHFIQRYANSLYCQKWYSTAEEIAQFAQDIKDDETALLMLFVRSL